MSPLIASNEKCIRDVKRRKDFFSSILSLPASWMILLLFTYIFVVVALCRWWEKKIWCRCFIFYINETKKNSNHIKCSIVAFFNRMLPLVCVLYTNLFIYTNMLSLTQKIYLVGDFSFYKWSTTILLHQNSINVYVQLSNDTEYPFLMAVIDE